MKRILLFFVVSLLLIACSKSNDKDISNVGNWAGSFLGDRTGQVNIYVKNDNSVVGVLTFSNDNFYAEFEGKINSNGTVAASIKKAEQFGVSGGSFTGTLNGKSGEGKWSLILSTGSKYDGTWVSQIKN